MSLEIATAVCPHCEQELPLSAFYPSSKVRGGASSNTRCAECCRKAANENNRRRRAEMGDEAFRRYQRLSANRSRARTGNKRAKRTQRIYGRALRRLKDLHPEEFEHLRKLIEREVEEEEDA